MVERATRAKITEAEARLPEGVELPTWERRHVLDLDDFSRREIEQVIETADAMKEVLGREIRRVPTLRGTIVATLFYETSTRTRSSFELAAKALGADVVSVAAAASSVQKGESLVDSARTLQAIGANILVMRHRQSGAPYLVAGHVDMSVINAGDGWHAHPTQGLLDAYTIQQHVGDLRGKKVVIIGDILHGRVARSNIWGLTTMGAQVVLCGPSTLLPWGLRPGYRGNEDKMLPPVEVDTNLDRAIEDVNNSRYGLQAGIYTDNLDEALSAARRIRCGGVMVNDVPTFRVDLMPYGGEKESGLGREGPRFAIEEMTEIRVVGVRRRPSNP